MIPKGPLLQGGVLGAAVEDLIPQNLASAGEETITRAIFFFPFHLGSRMHFTEKGPGWAFTGKVGGDIIPVRGGGGGVSLFFFVFF